jgi:fatty-acyl-CoA synthase
MAVSWLPLHHDMGLLGGLLFPFYNGFPAHMISTADFRSRPGCWLEAMSRWRGTIAAAPPSAYAMCLQLARRVIQARLDFGAWECAMVGAEPVSADLLRTFAAAFSPCGFRAEAFFPVYGLAEATVAVTFPTLLTSTRYDCVDRAILERDGKAIPSADGLSTLESVSVGHPIPCTEIQIVDASGRSVPDRVVGEILVRSPSLMEGYYGEPEATAAALRDAWLQTGDLGYQAQGSLFVTGRKKEMIIKGGQNLMPSVIEEIVSGVEGVRMGCVAAVGVWSPEQQTEMVCVVAETRSDGASHAALAGRIRDVLKGHGISVDRVLLTPPKSLPKTTSGKLKRFEVVQALEAGWNSRVP